ncbi:SERPINB1 [Lepeophtheirus salmonis]|uniref:SERPINB1 n=1 Tax=Lepeophtheirus salmonis TaxID=72036 RepID=A0A7R8CGP0_LEPSM|nr:SERPINB1 [Lepeophtheirus salmonis]CAF2811750.1 SERPINB1 [Lepeophtheirus salmonis]
MSQPSATKEVSIIAKGSVKFGFDLFNKVLNPEENAIFSSYSVASVLSMASMGAEGNTLKELKELQNLMRTSSSKLLMAFFPSTQVDLNQQFLNDSRKYFLSEVEATNFMDTDAAIKKLNKWVSNKTHDKIMDMFAEGSIDPYTVSVLVNAIYFKGNWLEKFDSTLTSNKPFYVSPNKTVQVPTMFKDMEFASEYVEHLKCTICALPYQGERMTMYILLPKERFGLPDVEAKLSSDAFDPSILDKITRKDEKPLHLPKFKIESTHDIKAGLELQGVSDLYNRNCDLSGVTGAPGDIYVSKVFKKAIIEVNEEGSEASCCHCNANSSLLFNNNGASCCGSSFRIYDRIISTGFILFSGRVVNPLCL